MALRYERLLRRSCVVAVLVTLIGWGCYAQAPSAANAKHQWETLNAQVEKAYQAGDVTKGIPLAKKALELARQTFGNRDPDTLTSLNYLALLYQAQGRYGDAEPLNLEALQASREVFGPRHPQALTSLNNLALLYYKQARLSCTICQSSGSMMASCWPG
jgi:tetratricopeptide (TPR) repeat protein